jgi:hypothetical protein
MQGNYIKDLPEVNKATATLMPTFLDARSEINNVVYYLVVMIKVYLNFILWL